MLRALSLFFLTALAATPTFAQTTLFVDATAPAGGDGSRWSAAFGDLQDALDAARANSAVAAIHVAEGRYLPDRGSGARTLSFELVDGVAHLGGYPTGGGPRDPEAHPTVLDGDLADDDGLPSGPWGYIDGVGENSFHVVRAIGVGPATSLDGFVIEGGVAFGAPDADLGGGAWIEGGVLELRSCRFRHNRAGQRGGGLALDASASLVEACRFEENLCGSAGAGLAILGPVRATVHACRFVGNFGGSGAGLAIGPRLGSSGVGGTSLVERCEFVGNRGAISATGGGGVHAFRSAPRIVACRFLDNYANGGGGVFVGEGDAWIERCLFLRNQGEGDGGGALQAIDFTTTPSRTELVGCALHGNDGGLSVLETTLVVRNSTITDNLLPGAPPQLNWPAIFGQSATIELANSIVWGNHPGGAFGDERDHLVDIPVLPTTWVISHSIVEDWAGSLPGDALALDPAFVDRAGPDGLIETVGDNDYRPSRFSPAVDSGLASLYSPFAAPLDLDGRARVRDGDWDGARVIDRGAYERPELFRR